MIKVCDYLNGWPISLATEGLAEWVTEYTTDWMNYRFSKGTLDSSDWSSLLTDVVAVYVIEGMSDWSHDWKNGWMYEWMITWIYESEWRSNHAKAGLGSRRIWMNTQSTGICEVGLVQRALQCAGDWGRMGVFLNWKWIVYNYQDNNNDKYKIKNVYATLYVTVGERGRAGREECRLLRCYAVWLL
jgi:hypothetical protein